MDLQSVPQQFFKNNLHICKDTQNCAPEKHLKNALKYHCIEANEKCKEVLLFLTLNGRFSVMVNLHFFYQDAMTDFAEFSIKNFDDLIDQIIYPIFQKRFSSKNSLLRMTSVGQSIDSEIKTNEDCVSYGSDCTVSVDHFIDTLADFYGKFAVINKEFEASSSKTFFKLERYYGTLIANLNFQLDMDYEQAWHLLKSSKTDVSSLNGKANVASSQLQNDLSLLLDSIMPASNISLTDLIGLLGYSRSFDISDLSPTTTVPKITLQNFSASQATKEPKLRQYEFLNNLHPLHGFDPMHTADVPCDLEMYLEHWRHFLETFNKMRKNDKLTILKGNSK